jgi:DNA-directed RNA polymerase specialized sigma24 family protein
MTRGSDSARPPRCFSGNIPLDARALGEAFRREAPMLVAAARAIVLDDAEAEDLVEVTFEIAIRRIADLRDPLALR